MLHCCLLGCSVAKGAAWILGEPQPPSAESRGSRQPTLPTGEPHTEKSSKSTENTKEGSAQSHTAPVLLLPTRVARLRGLAGKLP